MNVLLNLRVLLDDDRGYWMPSPVIPSLNFLPDSGSNYSTHGYVNSKSDENNPAAFCLRTVDFLQAV